MRETRAWILLLVSAMAPSPARAQLKLQPIAVEAERESADQDDSAPDPEAPPFVTVVDAKQPSARAASVADLVEREAGVHLRSFGGLGAFTAISIRGADPNQVAVFLDGVPLNRASAGAVDLSLLPADDLERVEIYRGVPPLELGAQAAGGAIVLVSRRARPGLRLSVGGGSFGARSVSAGWGGTEGGLRTDVSASYRGATGDFVYYDYRGTLLDTSDDRPKARGNDGFDQVALDATVASDALRLGAHGFLKRQGVPARAGLDDESRFAKLTSGRLVVDGAGDKRLGPGTDGHAELWLGWERSEFDNARGEPVGTYLRSRTDQETLSVGGQARARVAPSSVEQWTLLGEAIVERFAPEELVDFGSAPPPSVRAQAALAAGDDIRLFGDRLALTPALRIDGVVSDLSSGLGVRGPMSTGSDRIDAFLSPRLGARLTVARPFRLKGSVGRFLRLPTALELFGDGAFVLPRPALRPETAIAGDVGGELELQSEHAALFVEGTFFGRQVTDYIALVPASRALAAVNVGDERFLGVEARARGRVTVGHLSVEASLDYTFLHTVADVGGFFAGSDGKQLPGVPAHQLAGRLEIAAGPFRAYYEILYTGDVWRDVQNTDGALVPARALHALGASCGPLPRLPVTLSVEVRNLTDLRVVDLPLGGAIHDGKTTPYPLVDVFDYPLPGRAVYATLTWKG